MIILFLILSVSIRATAPTCQELKAKTTIKHFPYEFLVGQVLRDFTEAQNFCQDWGGNLASI